MKRMLFLIASLVLAGSAWAAEQGRTTVNFNDDWSFQLIQKDGYRKAPVESKKPGDSLDIEKTGKAVTVRLPHDWAISGPFDKASTNGGTGKLPWKGVGLYTKTFRLGPEAANKRVVFDFGGCMAFPEVYVNGKYAGGWDYGYLGFQLDATPYVKYNATNTIQVRCDTRQHGSRWYPGAGIYRTVRMILTSKDAWLPMGSVFIHTEEINRNEAKVIVEITPKIQKNRPLKVGISFENSDPAKAVSINQPLNEKSGKYGVIITNPKLWDVAHPMLYNVHVKLSDDKGILDNVTIPFGIREMKWTADDGFHLNGRRVQLYGVDLHHDQGILGAASHPAAIERQLRIMKEMGVNAIRTSHNPNSPEFMDACDRLGLIVWDELFDKWNRK